jgi:drug/metabolite transporter (DMT)-like permease
VPREGNRLALAAFLAEAVLAGGNGVAIRYSNRELDPLWGAGLRFSLAALLGLALMAALRLELPRGAAFRGAAIYGAFGFAGAFAFGYYALVRLHAGIAQTLLALIPLATLLLAALQRQERLRTEALFGAVLAIGGIAVISGASAEAIPLLSLLAILASVLCFAQATVLVRRVPPVHPVAMNVVGMGTGALMLVIAAVVAGEAIELPSRLSTWTAIAYLVAIGSVVVFLLYLAVIRWWSASRAAYGFVVTPVVTVLLSAWLDDEAVGGGLLIGGLLVVAGVYLGALRGSSSPVAE